MTFLELQQQVASNLGRTDKTSEIKQAINWALKHIAREHTFRALDTVATSTTTASVQLYTLPSDLHVLWSVRCDGRLLTEVHPIELEQLIRTTDVEIKTRPTVFAQTARASNDSGLIAENPTALRLFPTPNAAYSLEIYYSRWPRSLTADGDEPEVAEIDDAIAAMATWRVYVGLQMTSEAQVWWGLYRSVLDPIVRSDNRRASWAPGLVRFPKAVRSGGDPALDPFVKHW